MIPVIKKMTLSESVAQGLLTMIDDGNIKLGEQLPPEPQLCTMLGVSRTAVREGVKALAGINILSVIPGRGTFVSKNPAIMVNKNALQVALGRETFKSIYEVRYVLDVGIAKFAVINATDKNIMEMQNAVDKMEASLRPGSVDITLASEADEEFHLAFYRAANNKILEGIAAPIIINVMNRTWKKLRRLPRFFISGLKGHKKILKGLKNRDIKLVTKAIEQHLGVVFMGIIEREGNQPEEVANYETYHY